ncbi:MAG: DUF1588 domain-containing protein [Alphaproteobacteria bacterium]|nr:DUF1588 domain-containing protein [Alphaproteobacteria bacterium]
MRTSSVPVPTSLALVLLASACGVGPNDAVCIDNAAFFRDKVYPEVVQPTCMACHTADGLARDSDLVFVTTARPDHEAANLEVLAEVAGLEREGQSIVLRKPLGMDQHGGGPVLAEDSEAYALLTEFVSRLDAPVVCDDVGKVTSADAGLKLMSPVSTLRKAALLATGHLPSADQTARVRTGGEAALVTAVWELMDDPAFSDVFMERLNDVLHTDRYLRDNDAIGIVDDDDFPSLYWYEDAGDGDYSKARERTNDAIAREPLELAAWVMRNDRPWTEVLTADYTMVNAYSAQAYGIQGTDWPSPADPASLDFYPARIEGFPHAGMLTTPAFLNRYPTTPTNRNRHRAWFFYKTFLATDILTFADRPIDPTVSSAHNPTANDPQCTVCHATMDPVAGAFQNWDEEGRNRPREEGWYAEMVPPGFGESMLPSPERTHALSWLAQQAVSDPRFPTAAVRLMLEAYTGLAPLTTATAGDDAEKKAALSLQDKWVEEVATELVARDHDIKYAIERVLTSRYFRAIEDVSAADGALLQAGTAHLLTPEELDRKITAITGMPWRSSASSRDLLLDRYLMLYGGIDSFSVLDRLRDPNGIMAAIQLRMATEMACEAIPHDLVLDNAQRRLMPYAETSYEPFTDDGFEVPEAEAAIRRNLQYLHLRMLGEDLELDSPELDATYQLWLDTWRAGKDAMVAGEVDDDLMGACTAQNDPWTGDSLPSDHRVTRDPRFTVRAWVTVFAYLAADWRFLYE